MLDPEMFLDLEQIENKIDNEGYAYMSATDFATNPNTDYFEAVAKSFKLQEEIANEFTSKAYFRHSDGENKELYQILATEDYIMTDIKAYLEKYDIKMTKSEKQYQLEMVA